MQTTRNIIVVLLLFALLNNKSYGQNISEIKYSEHIVNMPFPQSTMTETLQQLGDDPDETVKKAFALPKSQSNFILLSFFEKFKNSVASVKKNKVLLKKYSIEEQKMMQSFIAGAADLNEDAQLVSFSLVMDTRPAACSGKLSWNKISSPLSQSGQGYYQQLLKIEKALNWTVFSKEVEERDMLHHMFEKNEEIESINKQLELDKAKLPLKKVKIFEGMDATAEIQDPEKMTKLLRDADQKRQHYFQRKHTSLYSWWKINEENIRRCANNMDVLLEATDYGKNLTGNDKQLIALIADVQERLWTALIYLNGITNTIVANAQTSAASYRMTEDAAELYKKMNAPAAQ